MGSDSVSVLSLAQMSQHLKALTLENKDHLENSNKFVIDRHLHNLSSNVPFSRTGHCQMKRIIYKVIKCPTQPLLGYLTSKSHVSPFCSRLVLLTQEHVCPLGCAQMSFTSKGLTLVPIDSHAQWLPHLLWSGSCCVEHFLLSPRLGCYTAQLWCHPSQPPSLRTCPESLNCLAILLLILMPTCKHPLLEVTLIREWLSWLWSVLPGSHTGSREQWLFLLSNAQSLQHKLAHIKHWINVH